MCSDRTFARSKAPPWRDFSQAPAQQAPASWLLPHTLRSVRSYTFVLKVGLP